MPNPGDFSNLEVLKLYINASDILGKSANRWLVDFDQMPLESAENFLAPFAHVEQKVKPVRETNRRASRKEQWWIYGEPRPGMRLALQNLERYCVTPVVSKHRLFVWLDKDILPSNRLIVIARDDDFTFGVLNSHFQSLWAVKQGASHGVGNDPVYNSTLCFETFPFPHPTETQHADIEKWAKYLDAVRSQLLAADEGRTMTKLYNDLTVLRETRDSKSPVYALLIAHDKLNAAVAAAYGWEWPLPDETILERLLALNLARSAEENGRAVAVVSS